MKIKEVDTVLFMKPLVRLQHCSPIFCIFEKGVFKMHDQHKKIKGYRDLSQEEIDLINECKELAEKCDQFIAKLEAVESTDKRDVALGKTNLQQGFMWTVRGIAQPTTS